MSNKVGKTKPVFVLFRICFVTAGIILAIIWASQEQRWRKLTEINPAIFALSLGVFVAAQVIIGLRWWLLLRTQSIFISFWAAVRLHFLGLFYNNVMPSSVGGDLIRAWYVTKHTDKKFEAALCVFVDRVVGLLSTLVIALIFFTLFLRGETFEISARKDASFLSFVAEHKIVFIILLVFIALTVFVLLLYRKSRAMLEKIWSNFIYYMSRTIEKLKKALSLYYKSPLILLTAFVLTVFLQLTTITGFWLVGRNLGITTSLKYYYAFFTLTWVLGAIPVSIGGAVVVEGILMFLFITLASVPENAAFALAITQRFVWLLASLPGAVIHLSGAHLPKDFFVDYNKPIT